VYSLLDDAVVALRKRFVAPVAVPIPTPVAGD
jgi:hypothetical protein